MPDDADDLTVLLNRTANGDRASFKALYRKTAPKLFGIVLRIVRDKSTAEDILQETYVRIWRNAESYSSSAGEPLGWLASIARNGAIDILRKKTPVTFGKDDDAEDYFERVMDPHDQEAAMIASEASGSTSHRSTTALTSGWRPIQARRAAGTADAAARRAG